jgi:uncharacterized FAD-dependent dehydrogenase
MDRYVGTDNLKELIEYVDSIYVANGAPDRVFGSDPENFRVLQERFYRAQLKLLPAQIRHMGTDNTIKVLENLRQNLPSQVIVRTNETVAQILVEENRVKGVKTAKNTYWAPIIISAPGRDGAQWFAEEATRLGIPLCNNQVDLGVRVEVAAATMSEITDQLYEPKLVFNTSAFDDLVRTFCVNPHGEVVMENTNGILTVNGHSLADTKSNNTNFALLLSQEFTEPFHEPIVYGRHVASLANMLSGGIIIQRYGDLKRGRRSTQDRIAKGTIIPSLKSAVPGDLSLALPHRYMVGIIECLEALDQAIPGLASDNTLFYGIEAKFYSARPRLNSGLQTIIDGLWAIGDGAGVTRGLIQASASGVVAARDILHKLA